MTLYRDQVVRVSLADIRMRFTKRAFAEMNAVVLSAEGFTATVDVVKTPWNCQGGQRRWLRCASCGALVNVLGVVPGVGWRCATCGGWRGRNRQER
jgi:hypothetical protein